MIKLTFLSTWLMLVVNQEKQCCLNFNLKTYLPIYDLKLYILQLVTSNKIVDKYKHPLRRRGLLEQQGHLPPPLTACGQFPPTGRWEWEMQRVREIGNQSYCISSVMNQERIGNRSCHPFWTLKVKNYRKNKRRMSQSYAKTFRLCLCAKCRRRRCISQYIIFIIQCLQENKNRVFFLSFTMKCGIN